MTQAKCLAPGEQQQGSGVTVFMWSTKTCGSGSRGAGCVAYDGLLDLSEPQLQL